jgi:hypothetical protein
MEFNLISKTNNLNSALIIDNFIIKDGLGSSDISVNSNLCKKYYLSDLENIDD